MSKTAISVDSPRRGQIAATTRSTATRSVAPESVFQRDNRSREIRARFPSGRQPPGSRKVLEPIIEEYAMCDIAGLASRDCPLMDDAVPIGLNHFVERPDVRQGLAQAMP